MEQRKRLRALVEARDILVLPGAYDALSAKIMEQAGFDGVYFTGYGQSASCLGMPDVGLLTMTEMAARAARIIASETGVTADEAEAALSQAGGCITEAIGMLREKTE